MSKRELAPNQTLIISFDMTNNQISIAFGGKFSQMSIDPWISRPVLIEMNESSEGRFIRFIADLLDKLENLQNFFIHELSDVRAEIKSVTCSKFPDLTENKLK